MLPVDYLVDAISLQINGHCFIFSNDLKCAGSCYENDVRDNHSCVENSMKNYCPVCYEYLFDSVKQATVMKCGHTMHMDCFNEMAKQQQYRCPICSKTVMDTPGYWKMLDEEYSAIIEEVSFDRLRMFKCPSNTSMRSPSSAMTATALAKSHFTLLGTSANSAPRIIPEGLQEPVAKMKCLSISKRYRQRTCDANLV
ncbi:hypothetical protein NC651_032400 [Populus alba x Populus x berolinensis]|nr:hypothetical protein NC651_032400 [Populus alba x Populus x berolinensis]